jgi:hypothetical protein
MEVDFIWTIRTSDGGATGLEFAQARIEARHRSILVHAPPTAIDVDVSSNGSQLIAMGRDLRGDGSAPMSRLRIEGLRITRTDVWPADADLGTIVVLHGGEAGELLTWDTDGELLHWTWSLRFRGRGDQINERRRDPSRRRAVVR